MQKYFSMAFLSLFMAVGLLGCTQMLVPEQLHSIKPDAIEGLVVKGNIEISVEKNNKEISLAKNLLGQTIARTNLDSWGELAKNYMKPELDKKSLGSNTNNAAPKMLSLTVVDGACSTEVFTNKCTLTLQVLTGDGTLREFGGHARTQAMYGRAVSGAILRAVVLALNDVEIRNYLKQ